MVGIFVSATTVLSPSIGWINLAAWISSLLGITGFWRGGERHPLTAAGFLISGILVPIWAIWIGSLFLGWEPV